MQTTARPAGRGLGGARVFRWVAASNVAFVLAQALLAGRGWFLDYSLIKIHGDVGSATFAVVVLQVAVACLAWRRGALGRPVLGVSLALLALVIVQLGLGFGGRTSSAAAAWHVPTGVLVFGLAVVGLCLSWAQPAPRAAMGA